MRDAAAAPDTLLWRSLEAGRIHSAYLLSGAGGLPLETAMRFARGVACAAGPPHPCDACPACRRSAAENDTPLDGAGRRGPLFRHIGDHPDLYFVARGADDTRVRIGQIRAVQSALRLRASEGGRRAVVIADAEWLNQESQNALLRLLEEPPPDTTLVLVTASPAGLLATVRSRCQRVALPVTAPEPEAAEPARAALLARLDDLAAAPTPAVLDWAEDYRGARAVAAGAVAELLETASGWLRARVRDAVAAGGHDLRSALDAHRTLARCRKALVQRNANPQMVAERALFTLREVRVP